MKVLVVHNRYRSGAPSGENVAVDRQVDALRSAGVEVVTYFRSSDEIDSFGPVDRLTLGVRPVWSPEDTRRFRAVLEAERPDVVHLHNPYPLVSPGIVRVAKHAGVPVVQSVHNLRHFCANGLGFRDGHDCRDCRGHAFPWPAVAHACYQGGRAQSLAMATAMAAHRTTWTTVDKFLPVSRALQHELALAGVADDRMAVVPPPVPDHGPPSPPGSGLLFVGRLDGAKGIHLLLDAWELAGLGDRAVLTVAGDGPERAAVDDRASRLPGVSVVGAVPPDEVQRLMRESAAVVVPSLWSEALGLVAVEAIAAGRAVVATDSGELAALVDDTVGWSVEPTPAALAAALREVVENPADLALRGERGRQRYLDEYSPAATTGRLVRALSEVANRPERRRVVIVTRRAAQYRVPFFNGLRARLAECDVDLEVLVGGTDEGRVRGDAGDLPWATEVPSKRWAPRGHEIVVQAVLRRCADADLVIMEQAARMLSNNLVLALGRRRKGPLTAFWGHGRNRNTQRRTAFGEWWKRATLRQVDWFFAYTSGVVDDVVEMGLPRERITEVRNSTDTTLLRQLRSDISPAETAACRQELGVAQGPVGLYVGSLYPEKALGLLVDIGDHVVRTVPDFHLVVVGDGPERTMLLERSRTRPWLHVVGPRFGRDLAAVASTASVMLVPGWVGLVVVDAAALGLPLITTDRADHSVEIDYLEHGLNGLVCHNDAPSVAAAVTALLQDPPRLEQLADGARQLAARTTMDGMVERFAAGILACMEGRPSPDVEDPSSTDGRSGRR